MKTIEEIKNAKSIIEAEILKTLRTFEKDSELRISRVNIKIDQPSWDDEEKARKDPKFKLKPLKGILDVTIHADIEDDPRSVDY